MTQKDLPTIASELSERYKEYHSIDFSADDDRIVVSVAKVRINCTTAPQYDYISQLPNVTYPSNSTIRFTSKAAASVIITVAKGYPDISFWVVKK